MSPGRLCPVQPRPLESVESEFTQAVFLANSCITLSKNDKRCAPAEWKRSFCATTVQRHLCVVDFNAVFHEQMLVNNQRRFPTNAALWQQFAVFPFQFARFSSTYKVWGRTEKGISLFATKPPTPSLTRVEEHFLLFRTEERSQKNPGPQSVTCPASSQELKTAFRVLRHSVASRSVLTQMGQFSVAQHFEFEAGSCVLEQICVRNARVWPLFIPPSNHCKSASHGGIRSNCAPSPVNNSTD